MGRVQLVFDENKGAAPERDRQFVTSLARGLEVLRAFKPGDGVLSNLEIAERTGLPKPTVSRLTHTLTKLGFLTRSERLRKYQLGTPVLSLGYALLANLHIRRIARPYMQELANYANSSVALGSRDRLNMVYIEHCRGSDTVTLRLDLGSHVPIATTSMGRAFLSSLPETEQDYLLTAIKRRSGKDWPEIEKGIEQARRDMEERGFCYSLGEWQIDVNSVGVPLKSPDYSTVMAFNCGGPSFIISRDKLENDLGPRLVDMVRGIEAALASTMALGTTT